MFQIDKGDFAQNGIDGPQDLHRREGSVVRGAEHNDPLNFRRFLGNCRAGYQPSHAVGDDTHIGGLFFVQVGRELLTQPGNASDDILERVLVFDLSTQLFECGKVAESLHRTQHGAIRIL